MGNTPGLSRGFKSSGFRTAVSVMGTLLESREALRSRGLEVSLTTDEVNALINNGVDSLARLALLRAPRVMHPQMNRLTACSMAK